MGGMRRFVSKPLLCNPAALELRIFVGAKAPEGDGSGMGVESVERVAR